MTPADQGKEIIAHLPGKHLRAALRVYSRAFSDDPILTFYLNEPRRREHAYWLFFRDIIYSQRRFGHVYAALHGDQVVAAASWSPPEPGPPTLRERLHSWVCLLGIKTLFPRTASGIVEGFTATQELHPKEPHWYLLFVGVEPGLQGKGIGSRLLAPVLESADRTGTLCYLETPFPRSHAFYRRLGFEIATESHPFPGAPVVWTLIRKPHPLLTGNRS